MCQPSALIKEIEFFEELVELLLLRSNGWGE
jgi:hypothetical protein